MTAVRAFAGGVATALLLASAAYAGAEQPEPEPNIVQALGAAPVDDDSGRPARERAIDRAFADAVEQTVRALVTPAALAEYDDQIRTRILRRARLYVALYRVREEADDGDRYRVRLDAWIDVPRMRQVLLDLGVALDVASMPAAASALAVRPKLALLVLSTVNEDSSATFGLAGGDGGEVGRAIARELVEYGFEVVGAPGVEVGVAGSLDRELPLTDEAAADVARRLGAGGAVVVGARAMADSRVRGTALVAAHGRALVRVIDADRDDSIAEAAVTSAAYGADAAPTSAEAARQLGQRAVGAVLDALNRYWPPAVVGGEAVIVEITGARDWLPVGEIQRALSAAPGIVAATPRRLRRGYVALEVSTSLNASQVARALSSASFSSSIVRVQSAGDRAVRVEVSPAPVVE